MILNAQVALIVRELISMDLREELKPQLDEIANVHEQHCRFLSKFVFFQDLETAALSALQRVSQLLRRSHRNFPERNRLQQTLADWNAVESELEAAVRKASVSIGGRFQSLLRTHQEFARRRTQLIEEIQGETSETSV
ncbi:hypothetical protein KOR42_25420 [Thalassoglobus neptunius]|uniref:Uncharacterized protein n=2 Tax=Thalassoglobus neptunius TaxID=1938619 RepID=A0A5C5XA09_9PLAN|nr:hypothetical protein KOR42_25420 [Thalassoglobus neptunius]